MEIINNQEKTPQINIVSLLQRTIAKVLVTAGIEETPGAVRMVASSLINIAALYTKAVGDDPEHIQKLFTAFLIGTEEEQKAAVKAYGEAFAPAEDTT